MVAGLEIRSWQPGDAARLDAGRPADEAVDPILAPDAFRPDHGEVSSRRVWLRSLTAAVDGEAVGAAAVWSSRWHPARLWAYVEVLPAWRRQGVGRALVGALRRVAEPDGRPLRAKVRPDRPSGSFATAMGATAVLIESTGWALDTAALPEPPARVLVADLASPEVFDAFRQWYAAVHPTDPAGVISDADVRDAHLGDAAGGVVVRHPWGQPAALGLFFDEGDHWGFSGGSLDPADPEAVALARDLILGAACFVPRGASLVLEVDGSMADVAGAAGLLGAARGDTVYVVADG